MKKSLSEIVDFLYSYCTDFIINLANLTGLSYYEVNVLIFCVLMPLLTVGLVLTLIIQKIRLKGLESLQE